MTQCIGKPHILTSTWTSLHITPLHTRWWHSSNNIIWTLLPCRYNWISSKETGKFGWVGQW